MGNLNFKKEPYHLQQIEGYLRRRGLKPDLKEVWEIHGPHKGMNYQVYVGYAISVTDPSDTPIVAIYPWQRRVYEIEDTSNWASDAIPENIITVER